MFIGIGDPSGRGSAGWRRSGSALAVVLALGTPACTPHQVQYERVTPPASTAPVDAVLYLVGDAGEVNAARDDVLAHLSADIQQSTAGEQAPPVWVAFLGDNIYDEGLPLEPSDEDLEKLGGQVLALGDNPSVTGVFLPGNHDWANGASLRRGRAAIQRQSEWVSRVSPGSDIRFLPDDGCPGPVVHDVGASVHLVFIDTEWLLRKPEEECGTAEAFYARLTEDLRSNADRHVILLAHHPLASGGPHGGHAAPFQRGPFVYYLARKAGAGVQDLTSRRYSAVIDRLRSAIAASGVRPLAFAAGHDHTLQVIGLSGQGDPAFQLVSGAGSKSERSKRITGTRYADDGYGYMRLDFRGEEVALTVFARGVDSGPVEPVFGCELTLDGDRCPEAPLADGPR